MKRPVFTAVLHRTLLLAGVWAVLTAAEPKGLAVGAVAVPAAVWLSLRLLPARHPLKLWRFALHIPWFLVGSLRGGLDVAARALSRRMRLRPGWLELPLSLSDGGRAAMGGELSLMPGTLAAGTRDGRLLVHLLDTDGGFEREIPREEAAIAAMTDGGRREEGGPG
jgi:multicomponent Na+:H+ antiporter subunit E